jgi:hypothetical protein
MPTQVSTTNSVEPESPHGPSIMTTAAPVESTMPMSLVDFAVAMTCESGFFSPSLYLQLKNSNSEVASRLEAILTKRFIDAAADYFTDDATITSFFTGVQPSGGGSLRVTVSMTLIPTSLQELVQVAVKGALTLEDSFAIDDVQVCGKTTTGYVIPNSMSIADDSALSDNMLTLTYTDISNVVSGRSDDDEFMGVREDRAVMIVAGCGIIVLLLLVIGTRKYLRNRKRAASYNLANYQPYNISATAAASPRPTIFEAAAAQTTSFHLQLDPYSSMNERLQGDWLDNFGQDPTSDTQLHAQQEELQFDLWNVPKPILPRHLPSAGGVPSVWLGSGASGMGYVRDEETHL